MKQMYVKSIGRKIRIMSFFIILMKTNFNNHFERYTSFLQHTYQKYNRKKNSEYDTQGHALYMNSF